MSAKEEMLRAKRAAYKTFGFNLVHDIDRMCPRCKETFEAWATERLRQLREKGGAGWTGWS